MQTMKLNLFPPMLSVKSGTSGITIQSSRRLHQLLMEMEYLRIDPEMGVTFRNEAD